MSDIVDADGATAETKRGGGAIIQLISHPARPTALLQFKVTRAHYSAEWKRLHFTASGFRNGVRFTVVSDVHCLRDPGTPERIHLAALLKLTQLFNRPSASGD